MQQSLELRQFLLWQPDGHINGIDLNAQKRNAIGRPFRFVNRNGHPQFLAKGQESVQIRLTTLLGGICEEIIIQIMNQEGERTKI